VGTFMLCCLPKSEEEKASNPGSWLRLDTLVDDDCNETLRTSDQMAIPHPELWAHGCQRSVGHNLWICPLWSASGMAVTTGCSCKLTVTGGQHLETLLAGASCCLDRWVDLSVYHRLRTRTRLLWLNSVLTHGFNIVRALVHSNNFVLCVELCVAEVQEF